MAATFNSDSCDLESSKVVMNNLAAALCNSFRGNAIDRIDGEYAVADPQRLAEAAAGS